MQDFHRFLQFGQELGKLGQTTLRMMVVRACILMFTCKPKFGLQVKVAAFRKSLSRFTIYVTYKKGKNNSIGRVSAFLAGQELQADNCMQMFAKIMARRPSQMGMKLDQTSTKT